MAKRALIVLTFLCAWLGAAYAQDKPAIFPQLGHSSGPSAIVYSRDGKLLASGGYDNTIILWDMASGRELRALGGHTDDVSTLAFSPDGKLLASGSHDRTVKLWDVASGNVLATFTGFSGILFSVAFSPDGKTLAAGGNFDHVRMWDVANRRELKIAPRPKEEVGALAFAPDGKSLAVGSDDNTITFWNVANGHLLRTLTGHSDIIENLAFSPDGKTLASSSQDKTVRLWDWRRARTLHVLAVGDLMNGIAFSPDEKLLAIACWKNSLEWWDVASGKLARAPLPQPDSIDPIAYSPDGKTLAAGYRSGTILLLDPATGHATGTLAGSASPIEPIALSPDGTLLATGDRDKTIRLWDMATGAMLRTIRGNPDWIYSLAFSPDGKHLASGVFGGVVKLWDVATGRELYTVDSGLKGLTAVAFSPDGKLLSAAGGGNVPIKLWDAESGRELREIAGVVAGGSALAFSPDSTLLATETFDNTGYRIWFYDVASGRALRSTGGLPVSAESIQFSPDGTMLAAGAAFHDVRLWDVASGRELHTFTGHADVVNAASFTPDGKTLISGSTDHTIKLWDVATGRELKTLPGQSGSVLSIAVLPDGKRFVSGGFDGTARVWSLPGGEERAALAAFRDDSYISVTPEGFFDSSSETAEDNLNVRIGGRVFGISSFRENFYRPDLVHKALAGEALTQYGSIDKVKLSPVVEFASLPPSTTASDLKMTLHLTNGGGGFGPVRIFWNGTVVTQDSDMPQTGLTLTRSYTVPLLGGDNDLRVTASNDDSSMWSDVRASVTANLPAVAKVAGAQGTLHAVIVGIQDFPKSTKNNLAFPDADAALIATTLRDKAGPLFAALDIRPPLTGAANTDKAHIVQALTEMQSAVKPGDVFVFYVASHGIVSGEQYYLMGSDAASPDPASLAATALSGKELSALLANIHAARKLVILDTCDAGAAQLAQGASGLNARDAATILARDYGFTVLAATTSSQQAIEGGYQNHGLFTYVVADGLGGKAADRESGIVSSFLLADYVNSQVPLLAQTALHQTQQPTSEKSGQAFAVTKVK